MEVALLWTYFSPLLALLTAGSVKPPFVFIDPWCPAKAAPVWNYLGVFLALCQRTLGGERHHNAIA